MPVTLVRPPAHDMACPHSSETLKHLESGSRLKCRVIDIIDQCYGHGGLGASNNLWRAVREGDAQGLRACGHAKVGLVVTAAW